MSDSPNSMKDIKEYLGCSLQELTEVWKTMSDEEKEEWKNADLTS